MKSHTWPQRLIVLGSGASMFSSWFDFLTIMMLASYVYHVSPYQMALISGAGLLPGIAVSPILGKLCDRYSVKAILLSSISLRFCTTVALLFADSFQGFLVLVVARSVFTSATPLASNVIVIRCTAENERSAFYAFLNLIYSVIKISAPLLGAISSTYADETFSLKISAALLLVSLLAFSQLRLLPPNENRIKTAPSGIENVASMKLFLCIICIYFFFVFFVNHLLPLILQFAGFDKSTLGVLISSSGAGSIFMAAWLTKRTHRFQGKHIDLLKPAALQAAGLLSLAFVFFAPPSNASLILAALFFLTGAANANFTIATSIYMAKHHSQNMGEASGLLQACQNGMILLAPLAGAYILEVHGPAATYAIAGGLALIFIALVRGILTIIPTRAA